MANPRIPYRFSHDGPALKPHEQGAIMVHLVVNVENWQFNAAMPRTIITPPHGKETVPDVPNFSWADYGMRAGLPRLIDAITRRGLPASTSINASVLQSYADAAQAMHEAGWEFIGHGMHQKSIQQAGDEAEVVKASLEALKSLTGTLPSGWLSPGLRESHDTPDILKACGLDYIFDWVVDDLPNWMQTKNGPILSMPYNLELNDSIIYAIEKHATGQFLERTTRTLRLFEREAQTRPRVLALGLHPHLMGAPHRFEEFENMLDLLMQSPQVCFLKPKDIFDWYAKQVPASTFKTEQI